MIKFNIKGQSLSVHLPLAVSDTIDYQSADFTFSDEWEGTDKWLHLKNENGDVYDIEVQNDFIDPGKLNLPAGRWEAWLHGTRMEDNGPRLMSLNPQRAVTDTVSFVITKSGMLANAPLPPIPPSAAEQIAANAEYAKEQVDLLRKEWEILKPGLNNAVTQAKSWAVGGTGTRPGEDTDNSKYYSTQADQSAFDAGKSAESAKMSMESAATSAEQADSSTTKAKESETASADSATAAGTSETNAKSSETAAGASADAAKTDADRAEAARDTLLNQKGKPDGIAPLGSDGKVPNEYIKVKEYTLPTATADQLGGVKADPAADGDTQPVHIGPDNKLYTKPGVSKTYVDDQDAATLRKAKAYTDQKEVPAEVFTAVITKEVGRLVCDMTASEIIDADRKGIVKAEYTDDVTRETRVYYYAKQMDDGRAAFSKDGYIEDGVPKQTIIYVDYAGNVTTETREPTVDAALSETSEFPVQNKAVATALNGKASKAEVAEALKGKADKTATETALLNKADKTETETALSQLNESKADLVDGKVPIDQLPAGTGGLTDAEERLIITIMRGALYKDDQSANINQLEKLFNGDTPVETWPIAYHLTDCVSSNQTVEVTKGSQYAATLTANPGYTMDGAAVTVLMGGSNVTSDAYSNGGILIPAATGAIDITAAAEKVIAPVEKWTVTNSLTNCTTSNSATVTDKGKPYSAALSADSGYTMDGAAVTVLMGGSNITASAYKDGNIRIESVTGDLAITATAVVAPFEPALPENGLAGYFDCAGGQNEKVTEIAPSKGSASAMRLKKTGGGDEITLEPVGARIGNGPYDSLGVTDYVYGTDWTIALHQYGYGSNAMFKPKEYFGRVVTATQTEIQIEKGISYVTSSGVKWQSKGWHRFLEVGNAYHSIVLSATADSISSYFDGEKITSAKASDFTDFVKWLADVKLRSEKGQSDGVLCQFAVYNRALSDKDVKQLTAYFKTLEVIS